VKRWVLNPALNCQQLVDDSGAVVEARSIWLWLQRGNSVGRTVYFSKGQACHGILPNEDLPDQKCRETGMQTLLK